MSNTQKYNQISRKINVTDTKAAYDENVKWLLAEKIILAHILAYSVKEFKGMKPQEVVDFIEGTPQISVVPVYPGESNATGIIGENTEDTVPNEGRITYDIRFRVWLPDMSELMQMIIDIEAQKDFYPGYDIVTRGIFYAARLISAQMGTEFIGDDYNKIKKVYSIWICIDAPQYAENTITEYSITPKRLVGNFPIERGRYDLLSIIMVCLSKKLVNQNENKRLHRFLGTLLSSELTRQEKKTILENEYDILMTESMEKREKDMCNLSEAIEERGIKKGIERGIQAIIETCHEIGVSREVTLDKVIGKFNLTNSEAENYMKQYWQI